LTWQPLAGPLRHTGLRRTLREGRWWETKDITRVVMKEQAEVHNGTGKEEEAEEEEEKYRGKGRVVLVDK
jgi:hypothetical protein